MCPSCWAYRPLLVLALLGLFSAAALPVQPQVAAVGPTLLGSIPAGETTPRQPTGPVLLEANDHHIVLEWTAPSYKIVEGTVDGRALQRVVMADCPPAGQPGEPELPLCTVLLGVPPGAALALRIVEVESVSLGSGFRLPPQPDLVIEPDLLTEPPGGMQVTGQQRVEGPVYESSSDFPTQPAALGEPAFLRHQRLVAVSFSPMQYRPHSGELIYHPRMRIEISFGEVRAPMGCVAEPTTFEQLLAHQLLNYEQARGWRHTMTMLLDLPPVPPSPGWRIPVSHEGVYKLTYERLQAAGLPVDTLDPRTLRLYRYGQEVAIRVVGEDDGKFDPADHVLFYGRPLSGNRYTDAEVYWLTYGGPLGQRMSTRDGMPGGMAPVPAFFTVTERLEQNRVYLSQAPWRADHDHWFWNYTYPEGSVSSQSYSFPPHPLAFETYTATLRLYLYGVTSDEMVAPDHHIRVFVNTVQVGEFWWDGQVDLTPTMYFSSALLQPGGNTVRVENPGDTGAFAELVYYDWLELGQHYLFTAEADALSWDGAAGEWEYHLDSFTEPGIYLLDVRDPDGTVQIVNATVVPTDSTYSLHFADLVTVPTAYRAVASGQILEPDAITPAAPADLRDPANGADYIFITHGDFYTQAQALADFRASQGLRVMVVDIEDVYELFAYGRRVPEALRDFLGYAYTGWEPPAPTYDLLLGDGHYDPKNYRGYGVGEYILPYLAWVDPWLGQTAADNRYVCVSGEDALPDMHLGRLPANTPAQAQVMVDKIIAYESAPPPGDWLQQALFIADNADDAGNFAALSDDLITGYYPEPYAAHRVYLGVTHPYENPSVIAHNAIVTHTNTGRILLNYIGHGGPGLWASERLLNIAQTGQLSNSPYYPVVIAMACSEGYYIQPQADWRYYSLAETFLRAEDKGWIASWSPTGLGDAIGHDYLDRGFFQAVFFDDVRRLGPATLAGKLNLYASGSWLDLLDTYLLFGDPALEMPLLEADLSLQKAARPTTPLFPGDPVTFTLALANAGPATAHHVVLSDVLSPLLVSPTVSAAGVELTQRPGPAFSWDVTDVVSGQLGLVTVQAFVSPAARPGLFSNQAFVATTAKETDLQNNSDMVTLAITVGPPAQLDLTASPPTLPANGTSASRIRALVLDEYGNPVEDGTPVLFATDAGRFLNGSTSYQGVTLLGVSDAFLRSSTQIVTATVTAASGAAGSQVQVPFVPMAPYTVTVWADPGVIGLTGTSAIEALVVDELAHPVANGTLVTFTTSFGWLAPTVVATEDGRATTTLGGEGQHGRALVEARSGEAVGTTSVRIGAGDDFTLELEAEPAVLVANGTDQATVTATLRDGSGDLITGTYWMSFSTSLGTIPAQGLLVDGVAEVALTAGTQLGTALVQGTLGDVTSQTTVQLIAGPPAQIVATATPGELPADGNSWSLIEARVWDAWGHQVKNGTLVQFVTDEGMFQNGSTAYQEGTFQGKADVLLRSSVEVVTATVAISSGAVGEEVQVPFVPMAPYTVTVWANPGVIGLTGTSAIEALVVDELAHPVANGTLVTFTTSFGWLAPTVVATEDGRATTTLGGEGQHGRAVVEARSGEASGATSVRIGAGDDFTLELEAEPAVLVANGVDQSTVTATLRDGSGDLITGTYWMSFSTSLGTIPAQGLLVDGAAAVALTAGTQLGTALVRGTLGDVTSQTTVQLIAGPPAQIVATATPGELPADGNSWSLIEAQVWDGWGHQVKNGTLVQFETDEGEFQNGSTAYQEGTFQGKADVLLRSSVEVVTATVAISSGVVGEEVQVAFVPLAPYTVTVWANPGVIGLTGTSAIEALVVDELAHPVANGTLVTFTTSFGWLAPTVVATEDGRATTTLGGEGQHGRALVEARSGEAVGTTSVRIGAGDDFVLTLAATPTVLVADGQSLSMITAGLLGPTGEPISGTFGISLSTTLGLIPSRTWMVDGTAVVLLTAGTKVGKATVMVTLGDSTASTQVRMVPGEAAIITLTAVPEQVPVGGHDVLLTTWVEDGWGHPVANGTPVLFDTTLGTLTPTLGTTHAGWASAVLSSGFQAGLATVQVQAGSVGDTALVRFLPLAPYTLKLAVDPLELLADGVSTATVSVWVGDRLGNPVLDGTPVQLLTTLGQVFPTQVQTSQGRAVATLRSTTELGVAIVQALAGQLQARAKVQFVLGPPATVLVTAEPVHIFANGVSTATVRVRVWDAAGHAVADGTPVTLTTSLGTIAPGLAWSQGGQVTATLHSTPRAGRATIRAQSGPASGQTQVQFVLYRLYLPLLFRS